MKRFFVFLAIAVTATALSLNVNAANPRRALVRTTWVGAAIFDAREDTPAEDSQYFLRLDFGPNGMVNAQYLEDRGPMRGSVALGPVYPLRYKILQAHADGTLEIELRGKIHDASSALYKTKPRRWLYTSSGVVRDGELICGLGDFEKIY